MRLLVLTLSALLLLPLQALALQPHEIVVVANRSVDGSVELARYYMEKRGIPEDNLVKISTTDKEFCSRQTYEVEIAEPIRDFLGKKKNPKSIRCLVTMRGVPLRVNPHAWTREGSSEIKRLKEKKEGKQAQLDAFVEEQTDRAKALKTELTDLDSQLEELDNKDDRASVDSELALLWRESYPVKGWLLNPYFVAYQKQVLPINKDDVLFVARLDAPSEEIVRKMIDAAINAESTGLKGTAYIDARWPRMSKAKRNAYETYDHSLHLAAEMMSSRSASTVVNDQQELFQAGDAPNAALYSGWYSVNRYVDAFDWVPGAVGYHIASGECGTLRPGSNQGWCKMMLEDGVAATLGPVGEPYLNAFPPPDVFFTLLLDGYYSLVETYFLSLPYLSWQMVLIGDPLYRPFKNR